MPRNDSAHFNRSPRKSDDPTTHRRSRRRARDACRDARLSAPRRRRRGRPRRGARQGGAARRRGGGGTPARRAELAADARPLAVRARRAPAAVAADPRRAHPRLRPVRRAGGSRGLRSIDAERASDPPRIVVESAAPEPGRPRQGIEIDIRAGFGAGRRSVPPPLARACACSSRAGSRTAATRPPT